MQRDEDELRTLCVMQVRDPALAALSLQQADAMRLQQLADAIDSVGDCVDDATSLELQRLLSARGNRTMVVPNRNSFAEFAKAVKEQPSCDRRGELLEFYRMHLDKMEALLGKTFRTSDERLQRMARWGKTVLKCRVRFLEYDLGLRGDRLS